MLVTKRSHFCPHPNGFDKIIQLYNSVFHRNRPGRSVTSNSSGRSPTFHKVLLASNPQLDIAGSMGVAEPSERASEWAPVRIRIRTSLCPAAWFMGRHSSVTTCSWKEREWMRWISREWENYLFSAIACFNPCWLERWVCCLLTPVVSRLVREILPPQVQREERRYKMFHRLFRGRKFAWIKINPN